MFRYKWSVTGYIKSGPYGVGNQPSCGSLVQNSTSIMSDFL